MLAATRRDMPRAYCIPPPPHPTSDFLGDYEDDGIGRGSAHMLAAFRLSHPFRAWQDVASYVWSGVASYSA